MVPIVNFLNSLDHTFRRFFGEKNLNSYFNRKKIKTGKNFKLVQIRLTLDLTLKNYFRNVILIFIIEVISWGPLKNNIFGVKNIRTIATLQV
jgi:hypothetical protein